MMSYKYQSQDMKLLQMNKLVGTLMGIGELQPIYPSQKDTRHKKNMSSHHGKLQSVPN